MSRLNAVSALLAELSSALGFSLAARAEETFVHLANDVEAFTDQVLVEEGLETGTNEALKEQVRTRVSKYLGEGFERET